MSLPDPLIKFPFEKLAPIYGLTYVPTIVSPHADDLTDFDRTLADQYNVFREFSVENELLLLTNIVPLKPGSTIMEIGVHKPDNGSSSSTQTILRALRPEMKYFGVDIEDRSAHVGDRPNARFIRCDSGDSDRVNSEMTAFGIDRINLLFIDGWHAVSQVVKDWRYVERLAPEGVVLLHDTNSHPGPVLLFMAIDEAMFEKKKHFEYVTDWGMAEIRHRRD